MAQFIEKAVDNELHPKFNNNMEENNMEKMRTLAFQVPEDLFQKVKDYLQRNNISQKQFVIGLIEREIDRDLTERAELKATDNTPDEELDKEQDEAAYNEEIVEDEDEELTEDEPTEDELTDDDIEQTDGELDEADEDEEIDQGDKQDEDEEESEDEELSEDEEETEGMTMSGM